MAKRKILVDDTRRELEEHGTETFPLTVNHDDLWMFEGKKCADPLASGNRDQPSS